MKRFLIMLIGLIIILFVVGCGNTSSARMKIEEKMFTVIHDDFYNGANVMELRDNKTGVHYLMTDDSITVMYNPDGSIKVD